MSRLRGRLMERLATIDRRRMALLDEVAALPPSVRERRPADGGWTILEVVEHMVLAELDVLGDLEEALHRPPRRRTLRHRVGYVIVLLVLGVGIPVKVPSRGMVPRGEGSLEEWRSRWDDTHARLRAFVASLDDGQLERTFFRHPITGPLTTSQAIRICSVHLRRHEGQIRRAVARA